jgi:hypothetical protein
VEKPKFKEKNDEQIAQYELQSALGFSTDDLAANQEGHLSAMQRGKLQATERLCMGIGMFGLLIIAWSVLNADGRIDVAIGQGNFAWLAIAGVTAFAWYKWKQYFDDIRAPEIASLQGRVNLEMAGNKNTSLTLRLQDTKFTVNKNVFLAFKNGDPYAVYFAPHSKRLLSAEWLREV